MADSGKQEQKEKAENNVSCATSWMYHPKKDVDQEITKRPDS
jgi:hypothetical protein